MVSEERRKVRWMEQEFADKIEVVKSLVLLARERGKMTQSPALVERPSMPANLIFLRSKSSLKYVSTFEKMVSASHLLRCTRSKKWFWIVLFCNMHM